MNNVKQQTYLIFYRQIQCKKIDRYYSFRKKTYNKNKNQSNYKNNLKISLRLNNKLKRTYKI